MWDFCLSGTVLLGTGRTVRSEPLSVSFGERPPATKNESIFLFPQIDFLLANSELIFRNEKVMVILIGPFCFPAVGVTFLVYLC